MADRRAPIRKSPSEILTDLLTGHHEAQLSGADKGAKYLLNFSARNDSVPNAVKFFLFDLLVEDAYQSKNPETCRAAVAQASAYLPAAQSDTPQRFREYTPSIRLFERGIALAMDEGELEQALALCEKAIALGLGAVYAAKRSSIERML